LTSPIKEVLSEKCNLAFLSGHFSNLSFSDFSVILLLIYVARSTFTTPAILLPFIVVIAIVNEDLIVFKGFFKIKKIIMRINDLFI